MSCTNSSQAIRSCLHLAMSSYAPLCRRQTSPNLTPRISVALYLLRFPQTPKRFPPLYASMYGFGSSLDGDAREAVGNALAVLVGGVLQESRSR